MIGAANLRSAIFDNVRTRPAVVSPYRLGDGYGIPTYRFPLDRSIKPLPTLPAIVGNTTYDPMMFEKPYETTGTAFLRDRFLNRRALLPGFKTPLGEPSKTNPTVL